MTNEEYDILSEKIKKIDSLSREEIKETVEEISNYSPLEQHFLMLNLKGSIGVSITTQKEIMRDFLKKKKNQAKNTRNEEVINKIKEIIDNIDSFNSLNPFEITKLAIKHKIKPKEITRALKASGFINKTIWDKLNKKNKRAWIKKAS